jgi:hypothetical protein
MLWDSRDNACSFIVRALPTITSCSPLTTPQKLWWNDFANGGLQFQWLFAWHHVSYWQGFDFDIYYTNGPISGIGNGLGGRTNAAKLATYDMIVYSSGDLVRYTWSNGDCNYDPSRDTEVIVDWLAGGVKSLFITGNNWVNDMSHSGVSNQDFAQNYAQVFYIADDIRPLVLNSDHVQAWPLAPGNPVFSWACRWDVDSTCNPIMRYPDAIRTRGTAVRIAEWLRPDCSVNPAWNYAAATLSQPTEFGGGDDIIVLLPYDLGWVISTTCAEGNDPCPPPFAPPPWPGPMSYRSLILFDVLLYAGNYVWPVDAAVPEVQEFAVSAYPNPFNPQTKIEYSMPIAGELSVKIYDVRGQLVRTLIDDTVEAGSSFVIWDGTDQNNSTVASGVYFVISEALGKRDIDKVALVR